MSPGNDDRPIERVERAMEHEGLVQHVYVHDRKGWHWAWRLTKLGLLFFLVLFILAALIIWIWRKPIADDYIRGELEKRGVQASYTIDKVGFRTQQVSNLVIGDPARPDLTVRRAIIEIDVKWTGSVKPYRIVARGVRLKGKLLPSGKVSWGQVDKMLPAPSGKPFRLPDLTVDLKDATVALTTPYGVMGFAVEGRGNLSGGFAGKLAASSPGLALGACRLGRFRGLVDIGVTARRPQIRGPIGSEGLNCPASNLRLVQPRMEIDSSFAEGLDSFRGRGRLGMASFNAGENGLAGINSNLSFAGTPREILGRINLAARQARLDRIVAGRTRFDGRYKLDSRHGAITVLGNYSANTVRVEQSLFAILTAPLASMEGTPLGPVGGAISRAIRAAAGRFDVDGSLRLINQPGGGGIRIEAASGVAPTGARVAVSGGDGVTYYWPANRLRLDGNFAVQGGGLPTSRIVLRQPRSGAPMNGYADIAPYAAGGARVTLGTIRFAGRPDGWTEVSTVALLDGPISNGRVAGLRVPISGRFGNGGALRFGEACIDTRFASLTMSSLVLGPTRLPLCPVNGALLQRAPGGSVKVAAVTRDVHLNGRLGQSPFALTAGEVRLPDIKAFAASRVAVRMGHSDAPVLINAREVRGNSSGTGTGGTFAGADAIIGKVPLLLSDAAGKWNVRGGDLDLTGGLTVSDRADPPKFYPLRSDNMHFTLANSRINATGTLKHPDSGTRISEVTITHNLASGDGNALLDVPGIVFGNALQPEEITRLTQGVIALVNGRFSGQGRINWNGSGELTSTGDFTAHDMDLAASFGPVTGMNGTIHFTDLLGMVTAPGQVMALKTVNPGILVEDGEIRYQLLPDQLVKIERGEWPFMGGRLILQETILNFGRPTPKRLTFVVVGLDAKTFVDSMGFAEISATGTFDGVLPMIFDDAGGRVVGGRLDSREGGGTLAYNGVVNRANLGTMGGLAFDALRDLRFHSMIIRLDGYLDGEFATRLTIQGVGLGNTSTQRLIRSLNSIPLNFNVTIKGPFRALIATAKSFRDPTEVIEPALPRPLDEVPGITVETRRREESQEQTQGPVEQKVTPNPTNQQ
ncbi:YdbH domain-containing protein [Sphingomonas sp. RB56-2]|uniref:YdbH domain-containing protein n=1 Tax=Sphingomonas brevis TaxID=2908206 RepID=A0ABT0S8L8_9SPHN|nr:YdbH domain-containing protein [Sphingomonas brevis]MCL6740723.1 YdbH domain-containing protein [Sphingomonas brevis]